ncbi:MAG: hypothetical protein E3J35_08890 [Methanomassiliicoccales archaeon]|nr:MAG: hypothetical protein E3J35_08890 [Methanomassiliicoccales archaeon]
MTCVVRRIPRDPQWRIQMYDHVFLLGEMHFISKGRGLCGSLSTHSTVLEDWRIEPVCILVVIQYDDL